MPKRTSSILGICLQPYGMDVVHARRNGGESIRVVRAARISLSLNIAADAADLVGSEIRQALSDAGFRERRCVLTISLANVLAMRTDLPELDEADREEFLRLQAEREFPIAPEDLVLRRSEADGLNHETPQATIVAVESSRAEILRKALRAAGLKPLGLRLSVAAIIGESKQDSGETEMLLHGDEAGIDLAVRAGGGLWALRRIRLSNVGTDEDAPDTGALLREIRLTLARMPAASRESLECVHTAGVGPHLEKSFADELAELGLRLKRGTPPFAATPEGDADVLAKASPAAMAAAGAFLFHRGDELDFLPAAPSRFELIRRRITSRGTASAIVAAAVLLGLLAAAFAVLQFRLLAMEKRWAQLRPESEAIAALRDEIRATRGWHTADAEAVAVLRDLTEAFPLVGDVWVGRVEIAREDERDGVFQVKCTGQARSRTALGAVNDRLNASPRIFNSGIEQFRQDPGGQTPLRFSLSFAWDGEAEDGS